MKLMHKGSCEKSEERYLRKMYNYIKCKSCMRLVEKSKGCNHMTCKCGFEFCYICGQAWRGHRVCEIVESVV